MSFDNEGWIILLIVVPIHIRYNAFVAIKVVTLFVRVVIKILSEIAVDGFFLFKFYI